MKNDSAVTTEERFYVGILRKKSRRLWGVCTNSSRVDDLSESVLKRATVCDRALECVCERYGSLCQISEGVLETLSRST